MSDESKPKAKNLLAKEPEKSREPVGIECRECGCRHFEVLNTVKKAGGKIVRYRACRHCGKRMTTVEKPEE